MTSLSAEQLKAMRDQNEDFLLINTLGEDSFSSTKIPGSINVPQEKDDFAEQVEQKAGTKDKKIVVYCASQQCHSSDHAAEKLEQAGFTHVYDFEAGAEGWKQSGEQLATAAS